MSDSMEQERKPYEGFLDNPPQGETPTASGSQSAAPAQPQESAGQPFAQSSPSPEAGREASSESPRAMESGMESSPDSEPSEEGISTLEGRPIERRSGARGTAAMDPTTRREVARKGGLAVSRNRSHMSEIGRKGGQSVSKNREHMAKIGRKGGAVSRGHHS